MFAISRNVLVRITLIVGILCTTLVLARPPQPTEAMLPDRYTPTPTFSPRSDDDGVKPVGAYIELRVTPARAGLWTVVQWQDSAGGWHDVEGWRGSPDERGNRRWWVAARHFGQGPFRWVVYRDHGSDLLAESAPFYLPQAPGDTIMILVSPQP